MVTFPEGALGSPASIAARDLSPALPRVQKVRFDLVGVHWRGSGTVQLSTRGPSGRWSGWRDGGDPTEDRPDANAREARGTAGWRVGAPLWTPGSTAFRYRVVGPVRALRAFFVRSPEVRVPLRVTAAAAAPTIVPRSAWGADESIRKGAPEYAPNIRQVIVHHTAGTNDYTRAQAPAIVRGIQLYHVRSNGWNDIGYNFLVDRFGTVYEGRYGGIDRNVVGAHAKGFNTGSVGVAVLGSYDEQGITPAARAALAGVIAWRLDLAHVDPLTTLTAISAGSDRFPAGIPVFLRAVAGHRDTGLTACPGSELYADLGALAVESQARGLPKLYEPKVEGRLGGAVRFRARLSGSLPWSVVVTDGAGKRLASGAGTSSAIDWTWDSRGVAATGVRWKLAAGPSVTAASGSLGSRAAGPPVVVEPVALAVTQGVAEPATITPNDDGATDVTTLSYTTSAPATVDIALLDAAGTLVTQLLEPTRRPAGTGTLIFDGLGLPDGAYTFVVTAIGDDGARVSSSVGLGLTRTLGSGAVEPQLFAPSALRGAKRLGVGFELAAPATVRVRVLRAGAWVATPFAGVLDAGRQTVEWDGAKRLGRALDGPYTAVVEATDAVGTASLTLPFQLDATAPVLRLLPGRRPRLWVSEPASLAIRVNGALRRVDVASAAAVQLRGIRVVRSLVAIAQDRAGNRTALRHRARSRPGS